MEKISPRIEEYLDIINVMKNECIKRRFSLGEIEEFDAIAYLAMSKDLLRSAENVGSRKDMVQKIRTSIATIGNVFEKYAN